jgi:hypothetical protein
LHRAKGEELYVLIDDHERNLRHTISEVVISLRLHPEATEFGEYNTTSSQLQRIKMLTEVYFPSATNALKKVTDYKKALVQINLGFLESRGDRRIQQIANDLSELSMNVQANSISLQQEILTSLGTHHADLIVRLP